ncbi:heme ABC transporter ATP-binding protein [Flavobacterium salilacus subsp. salilacus]|uniref:heme ABC transporter ATP-binding protein n=1 Tax=Flavobacterium TaxID=237 RepID=UPI001074D9C9|nr:MULTISPECIES: heme ABC transporter ATP-binding protein [Flavobacterium]KAF2519052.1 heme ABC transporter ATP-binding protein [Flavobacterium salilacus subsp. salilacus]MBE1614783.1 heme ABC transporter ATP-binding protein [Flavobacterium sp. SaA2.13]NDI98483.1 heme ABC transporter ATP-binding protein [Flavobacterium salilacus subsp. altitudinum]
MLKAHKISYSQRKFTILEDIDVSVNHGELLAIVGPNGAGKSTLLSLLANEMDKNDATIFFKRKTFEEWDDKELPRHKAKFSQSNSNDIPLSVKDVVMMGRYPYFHATPHKQDNEAVTKAMQETDVEVLAQRDYNSLSGGEKQRVHLARVLAQLDNEVANKLVFLDEPLNNLDVLHQHRILHTIKNFTGRGNTAIIVLHDLNLAAQFADSIMLMKKGKIVSHDVPDKVFTREIISGVYNFPCTVCPNPVNKNPLIIFGT